MKFESVIRNRRSIRKYETRDVPDDMILELLELAHLSPSRTNVQPWRFIVVRDRETKEQLYRACYFQKILLAAPVVVGVFGDISSWDKVPERTTELVREGCFGIDVKNAADKALVGWSVPDLTITTAKNGAIAATVLHLAAVDRGLGTCWVKLVDDQAVKNILKAPDAYYLVGLFPMGWPAESPDARPRIRLDGIVFRETFQ